MLYGDRNNWFAAYTYWYLKYYGHDKVKLVNGPREKWIAEGRSDHPRRALAYAPATFSAHGPATTTIRAYRHEVLAALNDGKRLVDVRSPQEFSGELIAMAGYEQEGAQRAGHIPGADVRAVGAGGAPRTAPSRPPTSLRELYSVQGRALRRADHRLLPHRRALGAHLVRAARAARPATTSRTTTARGRSGATS